MIEALLRRRLPAAPPLPVPITLVLGLPGADQATVAAALVSLPPVGDGNSGYSAPDAQSPVLATMPVEAPAVALGADEWERAVGAAVTAAVGRGAFGAVAAPRHVVLATASFEDAATQVRGGAVRGSVLWLG